VAVKEGYADVEFGHLTVEVPCHEPLAPQFHTVHLHLDTALAVVTTRSPPQCAAKVFRCPQGLVSGLGSDSECLPRPRIFAGRVNSVSAAVGNGIVAFACVIGAICRDAADVLVLRDLVEKFG
jgi:hypothetical protein